MSKFIQHPFDFQIRSAIRREACAIDKSCTIGVLPTVTGSFNFTIQGGHGSDDSLHLIAYPGFKDETGSDPIEVIFGPDLQAYGAQGTGGYNPGLTAETEVSIGIPLFPSVSLVAVPDIITDVDTFPIEYAPETLLAFNSPDSNGSGLIAEPEVTVI